MYVNSFESIGELLEGLSQMHLISREEKEATQAYLAKNKIALSTKLVPGEINDRKITWGRSSLKSTDSGDHATQDGVILHLQKYSSFDRAFSDTFRAVTTGKSVSLIHLMMDSAYAMSGGRIAEALSAAAYAGAYHAYKSAMTLNYLFGAVIMNGVGYPLEAIASGLRNLQRKSSVVCKNGSYFVETPTKPVDWKKEYEKAKFQAKLTKETRPASMTAADEGYVPQLYAATMAGAALVDAALNPVESEQYLHEWDVQGLWPDGKVPNCTKANALKVDQHLKERAKKYELQIQEGLGSISNQKRPSSQQGTH